MGEIFKNKIGIWAPLRYANYGDDMQALAFAIMLRDIGYRVKVFQLENSLANKYGFESSQTLDDLCSDVRLVIIAGGALLTPFRWYKRILNKAAREYEADFKNLFNVTLNYPGIKFCAISIGGDGEVKDPQKWYSRWRIAFFRSDSFINGTVRLQGDVVQMEKSFGKCFVYYADMLFQAPRFFPPIMLPKTEKYRVGFNFKKGKYLDKKLVKDIFEYAEKHDDMEFHFITTHMEKVGLNYQFVPEKESKNIFIDRYENPCQLLGVLASMDCFMTSMLHVGLTGLTTGMPFISYRGPEKTKAFLRSIGGEWAIMPETISFKELRSKIWSLSRVNLYHRYDISIIEKMKKDSLNQYEFCKKVVEKYA